MTEIKDKKDTPHYAGHRQRLRGRFVENGAEVLADYELLELVLFMLLPRRDVKPIAKDLLARFGALPDLMHADIEDIASIKGMSENAAIGLKTVTALAHRTMKQDLADKPMLNSWARLMDYCHTTMAHEKREHFRIIFLNKKNQMIADEIQGSGTVDHTPAYPREIIKRALDLGATAMVLVHNHPAGDPTPSEDDIALTRAVERAAEPFDILIHDHIIVSRNGYKSFRSEGLI